MTSRTPTQIFEHRPGSWYLQVSAESARQADLAPLGSALNISGSSSKVLGYLKQRPSKGVLDEIRDREAFPLHPECFKMARKLLGRNQTFENVVGLIWTLARSMCGAWAVRRHAQSRLRRKSAVLRDAVGKGHFSNLQRVFGNSGPPLADLLCLVDLLPAELQSLILNNCDQGPFVDCLTIMQQILDFTPLLQLSGTSRYAIISATHNLYVQKCRIAGRDYILRIEHEPFEGAAVVAAEESEDSVYLMTQFDDFGITSVQPVTRTQLLDFGVRTAVSSGKPWYHFLEVGEAITASLILERKGVRLCFSEAQIGAQNRILFHDTPLHLRYRSLDFQYHPVPRRRVDALWQQSAVVSNTTRAICVLWSLRDSYYYIWTTGSSDARPPFPSEDSVLTSHVIYQYFPLAQGEIVNKIWIREVNLLSHVGGSFLLRTSHRRQMIFGYHLEPASVHKQPLQHIFNASMGTLASLTWTVASPWSPKSDPMNLLASIGLTYDPLSSAGADPDSEPPAFDTTVSSPPARGDQEDFYGFADQDWFYSAASLDGLKGLQLCIANDYKDEHVVAIMLFFEKDRRECLGQWRPDCGLTRTYELPCLPMVYRYRYTNRRTPAIKIVVKYDPEARQTLLNDGFEDLPLYGKLIWWSGPYGNLLDHLTI